MGGNQQTAAGGKFSLEAPDIRGIERRGIRSDDPVKAYRIDIFEAWCKSCGICVAFCPKGCLQQDEEHHPLATRQDLCSGCGWCEIHCPDFAISVRPRIPGKQGRDGEAE